MIISCICVTCTAHILSLDMDVNNYVLNILNNTHTVVGSRRDRLVNIVSVFALSDREIS